MEVYTLGQGGYFGKDIVIDEYESLVWTERFIDPGEVRLLLPATEGNYGLMKPGTMLGHANSQEIMLLDTRAIKEGTITATGKTLETFFEERYNTDIGEMIDTPGGMIAQIFEDMMDHNDSYMGTELPDISIGYVEQGDGVLVKESVEAGPAYSNMMRIAQKYGLNFFVWRHLNEDDGRWEAKFSVHMGTDRTSSQDANEVVRFSPGMDSLEDVEEVTSDAGFKSVVVALPPTGMEIQMDKFSITPDPVKVSRVAGGDDYYQPFRERVLEIKTDDIKLEHLGPTDTSGEDQLERLYELMEAKARKALRKQQRPDMVSGEIPIDAPYKYKSDNSDPSVTTYELGDRVEFGGYFGQVREGTVTEYVRSSDSTGTRSFPGLSEKVRPVLQAQIGEHVLAWNTTAGFEGFWQGDSVEDPPAIFDTDPEKILLAGVADLGTPSSDALKYRWRVGIGEDPDGDQWMFEFDIPPDPPPTSTRIQLIVGGFTDFDDTEWLTHRWESTEGSFNGFWVWTGPGEGFWYEWNEGENSINWTYEIPAPAGYQFGGWHAVTQIVQTSLMIDT